MNAYLNDITISGGAVPAAPRTPLEEAQDLVYEAWNAKDKRRVRLARQALRISPDCADAYVLLAEETARSLEEVRDLYEQGVKAGERALGPDAFKEFRGDFWGILETRPYMRARAGLAQQMSLPVTLHHWPGAGGSPSSRNGSQVAPSSWLTRRRSYLCLMPVPGSDWRRWSRKCRHTPRATSSAGGRQQRSGGISAAAHQPRRTLEKRLFIEANPIVCEPLSGSSSISVGRWPSICRWISSHRIPRRRVFAVAVASSPARNATPSIARSRLGGPPVSSRIKSPCAVDGRRDQPQTSVHAVR